MVEERITPIIDFDVPEAIIPQTFDEIKREFIHRRTQGAIDLLERLCDDPDVCIFTQRNLEKLSNYHEVTWEHSLDVGTGLRMWAILLVKAGKLNENLIVPLFAGGLNHDIGKLGVEKNILTKNGPLDPQEYTEMRRHNEKGRQIVQAAYHAREHRINSAGQILDTWDIWDAQRFLAQYHHENLDGSGYEGLCYQDEMDRAESDSQRASIHQKWLIIGIARVTDTYSALRRARDYKPGLSHIETMYIIQKHLFGTGLILPELQSSLDIWSQAMCQVIDTPVDQQPFAEFD